VKKVPLEISIEDPDWHTKNMFETTLNKKNFHITENRMVAPIASSYKFMAKQFTEPNTSESHHKILEY